MAPEPLPGCGAQRFQGSCLKPIMNSAIKQRFLMWGAVPVLAAVLVLLAVLQNPRTGQVSAPPRFQMDFDLSIPLKGVPHDPPRAPPALPRELRPATADSST